MSSFNVQQFSGVGTVPEILQGFVYVAVLFALLYSIEGLVKLYASYTTARIELIANTLDSKKSKLIRQSPSKPDKLILPSDNQLTGVEFSYVFFLYVNPETIDAGNTEPYFKQVFYKGYAGKPGPLFGPGVFIDSRKNVMRVMMNSYKNWFAYTEIENIPISKWFQVALVFRKNNLEVYVNGNIAGRIAMEQTYPYQNYQDVVVFGNGEYDLTSTKLKVPLGSTTPERVWIKGSISGQISRLYYYRYALSYSEIQGLGATGPSTTLDGDADDFEKVPLSETWYTTGQL
jgi:hypothetical protein